MRDQIFMLIAQVNMLLCLVTDMLDLKLIEQGKFVKRKETFTVVDIFQFVLGIFGQQAKLQQSELTFKQIEGGLPRRLVGDHIHLKQVLVNLTKNALKFSQGQNVKIEAKYDSIKQMLHVYIIDNGKGIKQAEFDKLFQLFGKIDRLEE